MSETPLNSTKPYLLRAIFEWAEDNGYTPQVLVNARAAGVEVPHQHVVDGQIVLNISSGAVHLHVMDNDCLSFSARFSGVQQDIYLPMDSILAIFARENSQGIFFEDADDHDPEPKTKLSPVTNQSKNAGKEPPEKNGTKSKNSHLKIIK